MKEQSTNIYTKQLRWEELARIVIEAGRVEDADPETLANEVLFEALEQGATQEDAEDMSRTAREWYESC